MKISTEQIVVHDEHLSMSQKEVLMQTFSLRFVQVWLQRENLSEEEIGYIISKIKEDK